MLASWSLLLLLIMRLKCEMRKKDFPCTVNVLGRIQDLTKGVRINTRRRWQPLGVSGDMLLRKIFHFRASEVRFPAFSGAIWSGLIAELVHFFLTTRLLYVFTFSLGGSTEPPEPPLDPPQMYVLFSAVLCLCWTLFAGSSCDADWALTFVSHLRWKKKWSFRMSWT